MPADKLFSANYIPMPYTKEKLLQKIIYTNDRVLLEPKILIDEPNSKTNLNIGQLGMYKSESWAFQKEWRFKVWISPTGISEMHKFLINAPQLTFDRMKNDLFPLPISEFFLTISDPAFEQMEVTLNPKISNGSRTIIELLKKEYNPGMIISDSILTNTIR